jgi:hypothetical protein
MKSISLFCCLLSVFSSLPSQNSIKPELFKELEYRNLGAFRTGAWIADIAVPEKPMECIPKWILTTTGGSIIPASLDYTTGITDQNDKTTDVKVLKSPACIDNTCRPGKCSLVITG